MVLEEAVKKNISWNWE